MELFSQEWARGGEGRDQHVPGRRLPGHEALHVLGLDHGGEGQLRGIARDLRPRPPVQRIDRTAVRDVRVLGRRVHERDAVGRRRDATFVLAGDYAAWKDIAEGYDAGKAVMYRRLRLEQGDVFRFFNRVYLFTESLVAISKIPATLPA